MARHFARCRNHADQPVKVEHERSRLDGVGLLLKGSWGNIVWTTATAAVGLVALAGGLTGWLLMKTTWLERGLLIAAGLVLVYPSLAQDMIGLGLFALAAALQYLHRRSATGRLSAAN